MTPSHDDPNAAAPLSSSSGPEGDDEDPHPTDSFIFTSAQLTRDYVTSNLANASTSLNTATARSSFVTSVFGDTALAKHAYKDPPLLRQLESRAAVLAAETVPILNANPRHVDVDALVAVFALVAAHWPVLVPTLEQHAVILSIVTAMRVWSHRPAIVARCMTALRVLSITDSVRKRVMVDGGLTLVLDLMARYRADHRIQLRAPAVIANVAFGCTHRKRRIARQGGVRNIIDGMCAFPNDEDIQLRGALTIRNLTHEAQVNQYIAGNQGAVQVIASALLRFRGSSSKPELRFHCVLALESLCREDERNRQRIVDIDSNGSTLHVNSFSTDSNNTTPAAKRSEDGIERINEDGDIVVDEEEILLANASANFKHGGALFPGRTSKLLDTSPSLSSSACSERQSQPKVNDGVTEVRNEATTKVVKASLIRAIVHAIRRDPDDALLVETAMSLLTLICMQREEVQVRIGELDGVQVALAAMRRHAKNGAVVAKACALIRALCFQDMNRTHVRSGLVVMMEAGREHRRDAATAREVVSALSNAVFQHEKNRVWVVNKGGMETVVRVMEETGEGDVMVLEAGICALRNFVDTSESAALCAANEGAIRAAVNALERTKDGRTEGERFVQEQCVLFLAELGRLAPRTKDEMVELEANDWVEHALSKLGGDEHGEAHEVGERLVTSLVEVQRKRKTSEGGRIMLERERAPSPTGIGGRALSRGLFGAFAKRRSRLRWNGGSGGGGVGEMAAGVAAGRKDRLKLGARLSGVSAAGGEKRHVRLSARFRRSTALA